MCNHWHYEKYHPDQNCGCAWWEYSNPTYIRRVNVSTPFSWCKFPSRTKFPVLMYNYRVKVIPINHHGNDFIIGGCMIFYLYSLDFVRNYHMPRRYSIILKSEERIEILPGDILMGRWDIWLQGTRYFQEDWDELLYFYYVLPWYDTWTGSYKHWQGKSVEVNGSANILGYGNIIGTYQSFNRGW